MKWLSFSHAHPQHEHRTGEPVPPTRCCRRLVGRASPRLLCRQDAGYVFTVLPTPVAQTCSLLYRRVALCQTPANHGAWDGSDVLPITNRRYGRLKICTTVNRYRTGEGQGGSNCSNHASSLNMGIWNPTSAISVLRRRFSILLWVLVFAGTCSALTAETTLYVNKYFEVRDHDQPVKYVFSGDTRVARVSGSLSTNTRIQRLRLHSGWNLCSVAVSDSLL